MDPQRESPILEFIRARRERYTRKAITDRLRSLGHAPDDIERAWQRADTIMAWLLVTGVCYSRLIGS